MAQYFNILQVQSFRLINLEYLTHWIYKSFQLNAAILYPFALSFGAEAFVSFKRIEEFLLKNEKNETEMGIERRNSFVIPDTKCKCFKIWVILKYVEFSPILRE